MAEDKKKTGPVIVRKQDRTGQVPTQDGWARIDSQRPRDKHEGGHDGRIISVSESVGAAKRPTPIGGDKAKK